VKEPDDHMPGATDGEERDGSPAPRARGHAEGALGIDTPGDLRGVRRFAHEAMATVYEVYALHPDERYAAQAAQATFGLVDRLERELSRFLPNSDIARVNELAAGETTRVSAATLECLVIARHMFDLTGGAFDVSMGTGLRSLEIDADQFVVRAAQRGVRVDLGGIGKGYAVDLMAEVLEEWGLEQSLVHGGFSSVLALEAPPDCDGWPLTFSDPGASSRVLARLSVRQTALAASGLRKGAHIIDPRIGRPAAGLVASWVTVPRPASARSGASAEYAPRVAPAAVADALTTALMLLTPDEIQAICDQSPGLEAWILPEPADDTPEPSLLHFGGPAD
jgi:FAD:protein FMN transferase